jgi:hypothetical protein
MPLAFTEQAAFLLVAFLPSHFFLQSIHRRFAEHVGAISSLTYLLAPQPAVSRHALDRRLMSAQSLVPVLPVRVQRPKG